MKKNFFFISVSLILTSCVNAVIVAPLVLFLGQDMVFFLTDLCLSVILMACGLQVSGVYDEQKVVEMMDETRLHMLKTRLQAWYKECCESSSAMPSSCGIVRRDTIYKVLLIIKEIDHE